RRTSNTFFPYTTLFRSSCKRSSNLIIFYLWYMRKKDRYKKVVAYFEEHQPNPETELQYENPYQLLVAVILSAQCTDKRVNMVTRSEEHTSELQSRENLV